MTVSLSHVHVLVDDPDAALLFYRDTLGLEVKNEVANDGFRWITLTPAARPEIEIVLSAASCRSIGGTRRRAGGPTCEGRASRSAVPHRQP